MPDRKDEEPIEFKVVDRRKFNAQGELRPETEAETPPAEPPTAPAPPPRSETAQPAASLPQREPRPTPATPSPAPADAAAPGGGIQFEHLVMSLVTQAMLQLGLATRPGDLAPKPDFNAARETIDIIGILQEKTRGNLTAHEEQLLSGSLAELRLAYVEITRHSAGRIS